MSWKPVSSLHNRPDQTIWEPVAEFPASRPEKTLPLSITTTHTSEAHETPKAPTSAGILKNAPLAGVAELEDIAAMRAKTMKRGAKDEGVKAVQRALIALKYLEGNALDGDFGAKTEAAAKAFQSAMKLDADGIIGKGTLGALDKALG